MTPPPGPVLLVQPSPFAGSALTTPRLMREVLLALLPVLVAAVWFFGPSALLVVGATVAGAMLTERALGSLKDGTALLTGMMLGLTLPPGLPMWMAFLGGAVAIALGKLAWGGLGDNLFNPALVGRAFLQAAFPGALTTWAMPGASLLASNLTLPLMRPPADAVATATPLNLMKFGGGTPDLASAFLGNTSGSLGETSDLLLILVGLAMAFRRHFDWRIPVAVLGSVAALSGLAHLLSPDRYPSPMLMLFSGGLLFGTIFMATDPVTSPTAPRAAWVFGIGIGALVVLIRLWGGLPEGVMYALLLMNAVVPHLDRHLQPTPFGRRGRR